MKITFVKAALISVLAIAGSAVNAAPIFNIAVNGALLQITTNIPNHVYPNAGIKVNTSGYTVNTNPVALVGVPTTNCTLTAAGFCQISVSAATPKVVSIQGSRTGNVNVTVCLNALGPFSCQSKTFWFAGDFN